MKATTYKTFLPLFPGFYNTFIDFDEMFDSEIYEINRNRESKGLPKIWSGEVISGDKYKQYEIDVCKLYVTKVNEVFNKTFNTTIKISFESLYSPKEYNFSTDSINVAIEINKTNLKKLNKLIREGFDYLEDWVYDRYKSRSGFIPRHSNDFERWLDSDDSEFWLSSEHKVGAILELLFDYCYEANDDVEIHKGNFDSTMFEYINENISFYQYTMYDSEQLESYVFINNEFVISEGYKNAFDEYTSIINKDLKFWNDTQCTEIPKQITFDEWVKKYNIDVNTYMVECELS